MLLISNRKTPTDSGFISFDNTKSYFIIDLDTMKSKQLTGRTIQKQIMEDANKLKPCRYINARRFGFAAMSINTAKELVATYNPKLSISLDMNKKYEFEDFSIYWHYNDSEVISVNEVDIPIRFENENNTNDSEYGGATSRELHESEAGELYTAVIGDFQVPGIRLKTIERLYLNELQKEDKVISFILSYIGSNVVYPGNWECPICKVIIDNGNVKVEKVPYKMINC